MIYRVSGTALVPPAFAPEAKLAVRLRLVSGNGHACFAMDVDDELIPGVVTYAVEVDDVHCYIPTLVEYSWVADGVFLPLASVNT